VSVSFLSLLAISFLFLMSHHPFHMLLILVSYRFVISYTIYIIMINVWFSYIFILLFVGGLIVVFVYLSSLSPREWSFSNLRMALSLILLVGFIFSHIGLTRGVEYKFSSFYGFRYYALITMSCFLLVCFLFIIKVIFNSEFYIKSSN